ncbi:hypothetical protein Tco_0894954, partial [Tanacetum coccineum]
EDEVEAKGDEEYDSEKMKMSADVARGHGGDGGGEDRPPPHQIGSGCRGKGTQKPNLGGRKAGRPHKETRNLELRKITDQFGPQAIWFEWNDRGTLMPLGDHAANLIGEIIREVPMHFRSWHNIPEEWKARVLGKIRSIGLLTLTTGLTTWKASDPDVPRTSQWQIRMRRLTFGLIPRTLPGVLKMLKTGQRARSYAGRDPGHLLSSEIGSSATQEYPSLRPTLINISLTAYSCGTRSDFYIGNGSDGGGDDEPGDDEDAGEEEEDEDSLDMLYMEVTKRTMAEPILKKYMKNAQAESNPTKPIIDDDINIELNKEFLMELKNNAYHGMFDEDVVDHIAKVLELLDLIKIPGVDSRKIRMMVFPLSLAHFAR